MATKRKTKRKPRVGRRADGTLKKGYRLTKSGVRKKAKKR